LLKGSCYVHNTHRFTCPEPSPLFFLACLCCDGWRHRIICELVVEIVDGTYTCDLVSITGTPSPRMHHLHKIWGFCETDALRLHSELDSRADRAEADVGPDDLTTERLSKTFHFSCIGEQGTYALGILLSTSLGAPELWAQSPRSPPGVPAFSGGYDESSQSMFA
jgi:hypothetical protein